MHAIWVRLSLYKRSTDSIVYVASAALISARPLCIDTSLTCLLSAEELRNRELIHSQTCSQILPCLTTGSQVFVQHTSTLLINGCCIGSFCYDYLCCLVGSPLAWFCPLPPSMLYHNTWIWIWGLEALRSITVRALWARMTSLGSLQLLQLSKVSLAAFVPSNMPAYQTRGMQA